MQKPKRFFDQKGAAMVEFAIVLPLLVVVLLGIIEFSYAYSRLNTLNKATHEAARWFSDPKQARNGVFNGDINLSSNHVTNAKTIITQFDPNTLPINTLKECGTLPSNSEDISICVSLSPSYSEHIQITSIYQHEFITGQALSNMLSLLVGNTVNMGPTINLTASSVMRVQ